MIDTLYTAAEKKKMVILYRAKKTYIHSPIQSTVRFLFPRIPDNSVEREIREEWKNAWAWYERLPTTERNHLDHEYESALKASE